MRLTPNVRAVQVPETDPLHPTFTSIFLVGDGQCATIDTGNDEERYRWMLKGYLAAQERAEIGLALITHHHIDHCANLRWLQDEFAAEALVPVPAAGLLAQRPPARTRQVNDGDLIDVGGGVVLCAMATPGHSEDSYCYYLEDEGVLFSGDTILGGSSTVISDLTAYLDSLARIEALPNLHLICPGHGPPIYEPQQYVASYVAHRLERERQIVQLLAQGDTMTSWQIMQHFYPDIDARLRPYADANVRTHLQKLLQEGTLKVYEGTPRQLSSAAQARMEADDRAGSELLDQAESYRRRQNQNRIAMEENPQLVEWIEPPRYQLA